METGGDEPVPGLDHAGVTGGGAGLDDHDGLGGGRGGVHEGGSVGDGEFVEDVGDGDEVGRGEGERGADPFASPTGLAQARVGGGDLLAEGEGGFGPVEDRHRAVAGPGHGDGPGRGTGPAADVHVALRGPPGYGVRERVQRGPYGFEGRRHPIRRVGRDVRAVPEDRGVGGSGPPVMGDQPLHGTGSLPGREAFEEAGQSGTEGFGRGHGVVHPPILSGPGSPPRSLGAPPPDPRGPMPTHRPCGATQEPGSNPRPAPVTPAPPEPPASPPPPEAHCPPGASADAPCSPATPKTCPWPDQAPPKSP